MPITDRKGSILDSGGRLFISHGYASTSIDEICGAAGVTKGGFFHHFSSKEAFARELLTDTWQTFLDVHEGAADVAPREALHTHIDFMVGFISGDGRLIPRLAQDLAPTNPDVAQQVGSYFRAWTDFVVATLERAGCAEPVPVMEFVITAIEGVPVVSGQLGDQVMSNTAEHLKRYVDE